MLELCVAQEQEVGGRSRLGRVGVFFSSVAGEHEESRCPVKKKKEELAVPKR